jgi:ketosteroid isomerase-like protein
MTDPVPRAVVEAFYKAFAERDFKKVEEFLDDDVEWSISGPVDVLPFCGTRRGKSAVLDLIGRLVPEIFINRSFMRAALLVDGDRAATLNRLSATRRDDGRVISYRVAHFIRFCGGKVIEYISIIDSFDAAEQLLGHSIAVDDGDPQTEGDLVAV